MHALGGPPGTVLGTRGATDYPALGYSYLVGGNGWCSLMWPSSSLSS